MGKWRLSGDEGIKIYANSTSFPLIFKSITQLKKKILEINICTVQITILLLKESCKWESQGLELIDFIAYNCCCKGVFPLFYLITLGGRVILFLLSL